MARAPWIAGGLVAAGVLALLALDSPLAVALLYHSDPVQPVDALVELGGQASQRTPLAAGLYRRGVAPMVLISGRGDYRWMRDGLIARGVPAERILVEDRSASTRENALFSAAILKAHGVRRIALVTSWQHSARALRTFRKFAPDLEAIVIPTDPPGGWFKALSPKAFQWLYPEYAKVVVYGLVYGVPPWSRL